MFDVFVAEFSSTPAVLEFGNEDYIRHAKRNAITTTKASNVLKVTLLSHGMITGDTVTISGVVDGNGVDADLVNSTFSVTVLDMDTFTVVATGIVPDTDGEFGGSDIYLTANMLFSSIYTKILATAPADTTTIFEYSYVMSGTRNRTPWLPYIPSTEQKLYTEGVSLAANDFRLRVTMSTTNKNVSPTIERSPLSLMAKANRIDMDTDSPAYSYITTPLLSLIHI